MYSTKFINKNLSDIRGEIERKYITIGDPYVDVKDTIPGRWKAKQFQCNRIPQNAGGGYFGYGGKSFEYKGEPYTEMQRYLEKQPVANRKKGFGTGDANRRDEFAATIRTEQYRETLRKEGRIIDAQRDHGAEEQLLETLRLQEEQRLAEHGKKFLYDIGRSKTTEFDPKSTKDTFYRYKEKFRGDVTKKMGPYRVSSDTVGETSWDASYSRPAKGSTSATKKFFDASHLEVEGL